MSAESRDPGRHGVVPFTWACHRCARCCTAGSGYVWLADGEIERMAAALGMDVRAFESLHVREVADPATGARRRSLREAGSGEGGRCALLVGANECAVYAARPAHCKAFPYWPSVLENEHAFETARSICPGIAVLVSEELRERAFAALRALYARLPSREPPTTCCADAMPDVLHATGLEADHASACASDAHCRYGDARPLGCRMAHAASADAERALAELRTLERELDYPPAYGRLDDLLRARPRA
ncbi:MAG: YkgJ family cysteine cluster protein [Planctomycetota bacterium]|nr:MAG: YkgJ family cysteine cluster protein [Planctomycetota bacterium]